MKVLVSDYDKTFYVNEFDIKKNIKAVQEFRNLGNIFIIATGRSYLDFKKKVNAYNIKYDYVLLNHGSTILDKNDNIILNIPIDNLNLEIINDLELNKTIEHFCCSELESRVDFNYPTLTKIAVRYLPFVNIPKIKEKLEIKYNNINVYLVSSNMIEIISKNISKSKAIEVLRKLLNINKDDIYTIGDGETDIEMIQDYNGYAISNAIKELKNVSIGEVKSVSELINKII